MLEFLVVSYFFYNRQFIYFNTMMLLGGRSTPRLQSSEPLLEGIVYMRQVWTLKWYFIWRPICRLKSLRSQWVCRSFLNFLFIFVFIFCFMVCLFEVVSSEFFVILHFIENFCFFILLFLFVSIFVVVVREGGWWSLVIRVKFSFVSLEFFYLDICVFSTVWLLVWALDLNHINFVFFCLICVICPLKLLECSNGSNHPSCK